MSDDKFGHQNLRRQVLHNTCIYIYIYTHIHNVSLHVYRNLVAMWHVLTGETQLLRMVFTNLLEVLSLSLPYQEKAKGQGRTTRVETVVPKAVSA